MAAPFRSSQPAASTRALSGPVSDSIPRPYQERNKKCQLCLCDRAGLIISELERQRTEGKVLSTEIMVGKVSIISVPGTVVREEIVLAGDRMR